MKGFVAAVLLLSFSMIRFWPRHRPEARALR
jgi:hypothetical protein